MKSHFANGEIPEHFGNGFNMAAGNEGLAVENDLQEDIERYLGGDIHWLMVLHIIFIFRATFYLNSHHLLWVKFIITQIEHYMSSFKAFGGFRTEAQRSSGQFSLCLVIQRNAATNPLPSASGLF